MSYRLVDANEVINLVNLETQEVINNMPCIFADIKPENQHINLDEIRADERRKFAEWLSENKKVINPSKGYMRSDEILAEYEKGQKNEQG